jgi:hypothetical protein
MEEHKKAEKVAQTPETYNGQRISTVIHTARPSEAGGPALFCHSKPEILEFKRWKLNSVEDFLFSLKASGPQNLKHLRLASAN